MWIMLIAAVLITDRVNYVRGVQEFRSDYLWAQVSSTYYRLHDRPVTWEKARTICTSEGTSMLVPDSIDEMENIKVLMSNMKTEYNAIFIGIHDQFSRGIFITISGVPVSSTFMDMIWAEGRPNFLGSFHSCGIMNREGLIEDVPCNSTYPVLCKIYGNSTLVNHECKNFDLGYKLIDIVDQKGVKKCYKLHDEPQTWHDAYMICEAQQAHLAIVNSEAEALQLTRLLEQATTGAPLKDALHLGFSDLMYKYQIRTIFGKSLEDAGFSKWNSRDIFVEDGKRCGSITRSGFLQMIDCETPAMFLCEKNVEILKDDADNNNSTDSNGE